jgi:hypothetical protein
MENKGLGSLKTVFGGDPGDRDPVSRKTHRQEFLEFLQSMPDILPSSDLPDEVCDSEEGKRYCAAEKAYHTRITELQTVLADGSHPNQIAYHIWLCNRAQRRLFQAALDPSIKAAFGEITGRREAEEHLPDASPPQPGV